MKKLNFFLTLIIGLALLAVIIYLNDPEEVFKAILSSDLSLLLLSSLGLLGMHIIMAFRIQYIANLLKEKVSFFDAFKAHMLGMLFSEFSPGRGAYFLSTSYLRKKGIDSGKSLAMLVSPQPFDFFSKFLGASLGFILFLNLNPAFLLIVFLLSLAFFAFVFSSRTVNKIDKLFSKSLYKLPFIGSLSKKGFSYFKKMNSFSKLVLEKWYVIASFVVLSYTFRIINWYLLLLALKSSLFGDYIIDFILFYLIQPLINIVEFLPLPTPAGTGLSETASIIVLGAFGISKAVALAFGLLARIQSITISILFGIFPLVEAMNYVKSRFFE